MHEKDDYPDLDFANYLLEAAYVGVVYGSAFGVETMCGSRMLFRCPRRATRAGASRLRVRR
jgi:aspartate/methionine/tyrosine aminotransferase